MIWVSWREQRAETIVAGLIVAIMAALLVPSGLHMASAYDHDGLAACAGAHTSPVCDQLVGSFTSRFDRLASLIDWLTLLPGIIGVLLAAPFVLQLEHGTYRLDWTQSVSPRRWIVTKIGLAAGVALAASLVFIGLITWWREPLVRLEGRMDNSVFDSVGTVVLGYTLFALGLALAIGVVWRRAAPAVLVAFGAYFGARLFVDFWLRQRLVPARVLTWKATAPDPPGLRNAWVITEGPSDRFGTPRATTRDARAGCRVREGRRQPEGLLCSGTSTRGSRMRSSSPRAGSGQMQLVETGLFTGAAIVLIGFAAWWTDRRAA